MHTKLCTLIPCAPSVIVLLHDRLMEGTVLRYSDTMPPVKISTEDGKDGDAHAQEPKEPKMHKYVASNDQTPTQIAQEVGVDVKVSPLCRFVNVLQRLTCWIVPPLVPATLI